MMGDPVSTAIAVGGQILGGIFGSKNTTKESWKGSYGALVGHAQGAIEGARRTGFNPLTLLGAAPASGIAGDSSAFGQSVANAALLLADELSTNKATVDKLNAYQTQNLRLQRRLDAVSVRSPVPGVYGGARQPSDPEVYSGSVSSSDGGSRTSFGGVGQFDLSLGQPDVTSTHSVYQSPGVEAQTQLPEGVDAEDVLTGIALDGINRAKADGKLPADWEQPYIRAGQNAAYGMAVALDRIHRGVYYGVRGLSPYGKAAKRNSSNMASQFGSDWWKHQPKGAW